MRTEPSRPEIALINQDEPAAAKENSENGLIGLTFSQVDPVRLDEKPTPPKLLKHCYTKEEKLMLLYRALRKTIIRKEKHHFLFTLKFLRSLTTCTPN